MSSGDVTLGAIRQNWPILMVVAALIAGGVRTEMTTELHTQRLAVIEKMLDSKSLSDFARWQVGIERDIKELSKSCGI